MDSDRRDPETTPGNDKEKDTDFGEAPENPDTTNAEGKPLDNPAG